MSTRAVLVLVAIGPFAASLLGQIPRGFEVVQVTRNPDREFRPSLNDVGQCVFTAWDSYHRQMQEVFLYDSRTGELTQLTHNAVTDGFPDINNDGAIVWHSGIGPIDPYDGEPTYELLMQTPDGTVTRLTDNAVDDVSPKINNVGQIVWTQSLWPTSPWRILLLDGASLLELATSGEPDNQVSVQGPEINDRGEVLWTRYWHLDRWAELYSGGNVTKLYDSMDFAGTSDLNNRTQLLWVAHDPQTDDHVIRLWDAGVITTVAGSDAGDGNINDRGDVFFSRKGGDVWLLRDQQEYQITDDLIPDWSPAMNNRGECAWVATDFPFGDLFYMRRFSNGDLNCDGRVDALDIEPFILAVLERATYDAQHPGCDPLQADLNGDGAVDAFDTEPFVKRLFR